METRTVGRGIPHDRSEQQLVTVTADAAVGQNFLTVDPLTGPLATNDRALTEAPSSFYAIQTSGPRLGKTNY